VSFEKVNLRCFALDCRGVLLDFVPDVQEITKFGDPMRSFRVYFLFEKQLSPDSLDQPYVIQYRYEADDPYPNLGKRGEASTVTRWQGDAEDMILAIGFPRAKLKPQPRHSDIWGRAPDQLRELDYHLDAGEKLVQSEEIPLTDFITCMDLDHPPERYFLVGRRARNVKPGQTFGLVIE